MTSPEKKTSPHIYPIAPIWFIGVGLPVLVAAIDARSVVGTVLSGALFIFGCYLAAPLISRWLRKCRHRRLLTSTPRTLIQNVRDGATVKISGRVCLASSSLAAPISGKSCVYFLTRVRLQNSDDGPDWHDTVYLERSVDFWVEDATGRALVRTANSEVLTAEPKRLLMTSLPLPQADESFPDLPPTPSELGLATYQESIIEEGQMVVVLGTGHWEAAEEPPLVLDAYRSPPPQKLVIGMPTQGPLLFGTDPRVLQSA